MTPDLQREPVQFWSCGGGVQSCAIAALICSGRLPKPGLSAIVDTGREKASTWHYMDEVLVPALDAVGVRLHRISKADYATVDLYGHNGDLLLPVFTTQNGGIAKMPTFCSNEWKQRVADRWLRKHGVRDCVKWIGFSIDEANRVIRMRNSYGDRVRFPLVDDVMMNRRECVTAVKDMGWPEPPRSACWMCPNMGDHEWREMKANHLNDFQMAVELEREVRKKDQHAWLHNSCIPLDQVDFTQPEDLFSRACDSGNCFV